MTREGLSAVLGFYADKRLQNGWPSYGIDTDGQLTAVMLITPYDSTATAVTARLEAKVHASIGAAAHSRMIAFEAASDANEPAGSFHFVGMLGVEPSSQGRGYGRMLLDVIKGVAADDGIDGVALSTEDPNNLPFYERLGFTRTGHSHLAGEPPLDTWGLKWLNAGAPYR